MPAKLNRIARLEDVQIQPLWLRITHWLNAFAVLIMVTSG